MPLPPPASLPKPPLAYRYASSRPEVPDRPRESLDAFLARGGNVETLPTQVPFLVTARPLHSPAPLPMHGNGNRSTYK